MKRDYDDDMKENRKNNFQKINAIEWRHYFNLILQINWRPAKCFVLMAMITIMVTWCFCCYKSTTVYLLQIYCNSNSFGLHNHCCTILPLIFNWISFFLYSLGRWISRPTTNVFCFFKCVWVTAVQLVTLPSSQTLLVCLAVSLSLSLVFLSSDFYIHSLFLSLAGIVQFLHHLYLISTHFKEQSGYICLLFIIPESHPRKNFFLLFFFSFNC